MTAPATVPPNVLELVRRPALRPLWEELARRFGASDRPVRSVRLRGLDVGAQRALAEVTGGDRLPGPDPTVRVDRLAAALGLDDPGLRQLVETLVGPVGNRAEQAARERAEREALWAAVADHVTGRSLAPWVERLRRGGIPDGDVAAHRARLDHVLAVLDELPRPAPTPLPLLAATTLGDPHALDAGGWVAGAVLDALAVEAGAAAPGNAEAQRRLWARSGVVADRLSAPVLTRGLVPAGGSPLAGALSAFVVAGEPVAVTASQLQRWPLVGAAGRVWVVENPSIVEAARLAGVEAPLVCTASWPTEAAVLLLDQLRDAGAELYYHSDFDATGLALTGHLIRRFGARPWRMSTDDYTAAATAAAVPLVDAHRLPDTPWDPALRGVMRDAGVVVFEEDVADVLLEDLTR